MRKIRYALCEHCDGVPTNIYCVDGERGGGGRQCTGGHPTTLQLRDDSKKRCERKKLWWGWQHCNILFYRDTKVSETSRRLLPRKGTNLLSLEYLFSFVRDGARPQWPSGCCQLYSPIHSEHVRCQCKESNSEF